MELWLSLVLGLIGVAYFMYGKKESEFSFMLAGGLLCGYPYVVSNIVAVLAIGAVLMASAFVARRMAS
jgi:hypothetical protein